MRRFALIAACLSACFAAAPSLAAPVSRNGVTGIFAPPAVLILGMPESQARAVLSSQPSAVGLGVFPDSRVSSDFLDQIGFAAPRGLTGEPGPLGGAPGKLERALTADGASVETTVMPDASGGDASHLAVALPSANGGEASGARIVVAVIGDASDAQPLFAQNPSHTIVVGVGARTPLLIGVLGQPGLLDHGVAERPGVVTPYDLAATIAKAAGVKPVPGGRALQVRPDPHAMQTLDGLRARFLRDRGFGPGLTGVTAGLAIFGAVLAVSLAKRRSNWSAAFARAAAMVPAGYVGALFVPSSHWYIRSTVLVAAFIAGFMWPARSSRRFCGAAVLLSAVAIGVLTVIASRHPGGEPALSLWGDPLNSWRFFGIRNHLAAFLAGGFVLGSALLEAPLWLMAPGAAVAGVVVGAPTLGAQFIGVLTLAFGSALLLLGAIQKRVRVWHIPVAIVVATGAAAGALFADAGRVYSHGGTAVESIRAGGWSTAWQFFRLRAHLNYNEFTSLGIKGWITFVLVAVALAWLFVWTFRPSSLPPLLRAGVAGVAAAGMAALVVEDSGFLTAGIYLLYPALGYATGFADRALLGTDLGGAPPPHEPPHDPNHDHDGDDHAHERE